MPPEAEGNGGQGQEPGTGTQGQGQEPGSQQGQNGQGQEPGQQSGQQGPADVSKMSPEELQTYAATLQKELGQVRGEAANYRTQFQTAQQAITEAERAKMSDLEKAQADLEAARGETVTERQAREALEAKVEDLTRGSAVREALGQAGALNPATAFKVGEWKGVQLREDGSVEPESFQAAVQALRKSDPYLFRRTASADAGAGQGGAPEGGPSINDFVRGRVAR